MKVKGNQMTEPQISQPTDEADPVAPTDEKASDQSARITELEKQLAEMKDRALREMADAENTRRRAQKDREETSKYAVGNFAKEILNVSDNFRRAIDAAPKDNIDPAVKNLIEGIDATERQLQSTLDRFGIKKIEPIGQPFDPHFHRVMLEVDTKEHPPGTVVQVLQAGYMIFDRLLREALVAVAKGASEAASHVDRSA